MKRLSFLKVVVLMAVFGPATVHADGRIVRHDLNVRLDPGRQSITVDDRIEIAGGGRITLHLAAGLAVTEFVVDGRRPLPLPRDSGWSVDLGPQGTHRLDIRYAGVFQSDAAAGTRAGAQLQIGGAGTYLPAHRAWIPRIGDDHFSYRLAVEIPEPHRVVVPGRLVEEHVGRLYRAVVESEAPTDSIVLVGGILSVADRRHGDIRLRTAFHPRIADLADGYLESAGAFIDTYSRTVGPYPFSRFDMVSGPHPVGLGFPGMTYMGWRVLALPFIRHRSLRHEVLHNWWGNGVAVDYGGGNWAEGLTTFMADYAAAEERGAAAARDMRLAWLRDYAALPGDRDHAIVSFVGKRHDAAQVIGYNKVAFVFHMLRREIGEAAFATALRDLWRSHRFQIAAWDDLRAAFSTAADRDLAPFFGQWLERVGAPRLRLRQTTVTGAGEGFDVAVDLEQDAPAYDLTLPVTVHTSDGEERFTVSIGGTTGRHVLRTTGRPASLVVDPDFEVFRRLDATEAPPILRDVTLDSRTATVIPDREPEIQQPARRLAERLLDTAPRYRTPEEAMKEGAGLLVIGRRESVAVMLRQAGLAAPPPTIAGRGKARAWAGRQNGRSYIAVIVDDRREFPGLIRALPHFGGRGFIIMDEGGVVERGAWPATGGPLRADLRR
jgi:aminopeptidase N